MLVYTIVRRQTKDLTTADSQRVHHHNAVLIKENESDQRESNGNSKRSEKLHCVKKPKLAKCTDYGAGEH